MALVGLEGRIVEVEADIGAGLPRTVLVGLPDSALYQARDRCKAAVSNSGQEWPISLLTINLSPATLPKAGSHYDLAIVAAVLAAQGIFRTAELRRTALLGELGLDGRLRPVRGVLPATLAAQQAGFTRVIVPLRQAGEAKLVAGIDVFGVASITQLVAFLQGRPMPLVEPIEVIGEQAGKHAKRRLDLADVVGQVEAKWACEVAAAGRHHLLFHGPPGVGKTMLAERVPGLLPDLDVHDALEVSAVHSLAGFNLADELITRPPYSDPHHSASVASIVGGGQRIAKAGSDLVCPQGCALSRRGAGIPSSCHRGASYAAGVGHDHARPQRGTRPLSRRVSSSSSPPIPVPCGQAATPGGQCQCAPTVVRRYAEKISGPIRDRIDINQAFLPLRKAYLKATLQQTESSAVVAERVLQARDRQRRRLAGSGWQTNSEVSGTYLRRHLPLPDGLQTVDEAVDRGRLSARGVDKVLRLAWTIADLAGRDVPGRDELAIALAMRRGEQPGAARRQAV